MTRLTIVAAALILTGCAGLSAPAPNDTAPLTTAGPAGLTALPVDGVQPWEHVDAKGFVVPAATDSRGTSDFPGNAEFVPGRDRFLEGGDVVDNGEASTITAAAGAGTLSYAIYRLPMGGSEPGTVAVDANLHDSGGQLSQYWLGLSDYGTGRWEWHGPFSEAQVLLSPAAGDYTSSLGNTFVAIAAYDGAQLDVVGVLVAPLVTSDTTPPPAPSAPTLTPVGGGIELNWANVIAGDLAGYRIHWSYSPFTLATDNGVNTINSLENTTRALLPVQLSREVWVALSAVDIYRNSSGLSPVVSGFKQKNGTILNFRVTTPQVSALRNDTVLLTASGADLYDFDTDGDGVFEITGSASNTTNVNTTATGLIRPRVRGTSTDGTGVAFGSVSMIIFGNQRPVANAQCTPQQGIAPLSVSMNGTGEDFDGSIAEYAWDFDGDGIYDHNSGVDGLTAENYTAPGLFNAKLRVTDNLGAWDVDTIAILVTSAETVISHTPLEPEPGDTVTLSVDPPGPVTTVEWDLDGDGSYEFSSGSATSIEYSPAQAGYHPLGVRVTLAGGAGTLLGQMRLLVRGWRQTLAVPGTQAFEIDLAQINGHPAMAYYSSGSGVFYVRATDPEGTAFGAPHVIHAASVGQVRLLDVAGHPAILYLDNTEELQFVRSSDDDGINWGSPVPVGGGVTYRYDMDLVNGSPAVAFQTNASTDLYYVRANAANGSSWGAPVALDTADVTGLDPSLEVVNGKPAVLYYSVTDNDTYFVRSDDSDGTSWAARVRAGSGLRGEDLAVVDGTPAFAYPFGASPSQIVLRRADDADGSSWGRSTTLEWVFSSTTNLRFATVGGKPVLSWNANRAYVLRALDTQGHFWAPREQSGFTSSTYVGREGLASINGSIGIAYQADGEGLTLTVRY